MSKGPSGNRTHNQRIKSPLLCLIELSAQWLAHHLDERAGWVIQKLSFSSLLSQFKGVFRDLQLKLDPSAGHIP